MKMWSGRFTQATDKEADDFNSSLKFDKRLYYHDIKGSVAHCEMLASSAIITDAESQKIVSALNKILQDIENNVLTIENAEDIHMFIEAELTARIGDIGKKLHTARSRNDQVALDIRLYMRDSILHTKKLLSDIINVIFSIANDNLLTIIPAYTHMQKAQPSTLAHYLMAYAEMFLRDIEKLNHCFYSTNVMPLGSGACTGTTFPIDRELVAQKLQFPAVTENSLDGVSDRDFAIEYLSACSTIMMHLSRISEEIIYWSTDEFGYIVLSDQFSTGSSIMPQKKNPDMSELMRGKTGRVYGNLLSLLTTMKGLPLAYNKDMQEDKECIFDTEDTVNACLSLFASMLPSFTYVKEKLLLGANGGYTVATDCADYLVKKGIPFREAHSIIGKLVHFCSQNSVRLDQISIADYKQFSPLFEQDILDVVKLQNVIENRKTIGAPSSSSMKNSIVNAKKKLDILQKAISYVELI